MHKKNDNNSWWLVIEGSKDAAMHIKGDHNEAHATAERLCELYGSRVFVLGQRAVYEPKFD